MINNFMTGNLQLNIQSATNADDLAGNIIALFAGQKQGYIGNIFGGTKPAQRNAGFVFIGTFAFF
jgi:hypothetical protein